MAPKPNIDSDLATVVLVDDHELFRSGLRELLREAGVTVLGEAGDGADAVELVDRTAPDVVLMDINLPGISGVEATRRLAARAPHVRVLMLTISASDADVLDALMAGATGYLLKDAPIDELVDGIYSAARGEATINPQIAAQLIAHLRKPSPPADDPGVAPADLSEREIEVLRLIAAGKANGEIAAELYLGTTTVKKHIASILLKLQMENRIQAAVYAVRSRII